MELTKLQIAKLEELLDDAWASIGPAMAKQKPFFILKAINDQLKADGYDDQYDLNDKGKKLQELYEQIYRQNRELIEK